MLSYILKGGHQEDAEEFFGFFLDTLEEELLTIANSLSPANPKVNGPIEEHEEPEPPHGDGWLEVGKRNRTVVTRTVSTVLSLPTLASVWRVHHNICRSNRPSHQSLVYLVGSSARRCVRLISAILSPLRTGEPFD